LLVNPIPLAVRLDGLRCEDTAIEGEKQMSLAPVFPDDPDAPIPAGIGQIRDPLAIG
jgi:hypothetical protein